MGDAAAPQDPRADRASRASRYLRAQLRLGSYASVVIVAVGSVLLMRYVQHGLKVDAPGAFTSTFLFEFTVFWAVIIIAVAFLALQTYRPKACAYIWMGTLLLFGTFSLVVTALSSAEQAKAIIEKFATDINLSVGNGLLLFLTAAALYSQPLTLRTRFMTVAGHIALRTLQGPILYTRVGPQWGLKWLRFC